MKTMKVDNLDVKIFPTRDEMGACAAKDIHDKIVELLICKSEYCIEKDLTVFR